MTMPANDTLNQTTAAAQPQKKTARRRGRLILALVLAAAVATALGILVKKVRHKIFMDNFGVVEPNAIYRSGQLTPNQLETLIARKNIKTVLNLRPKSEAPSPAESETEICRKAGVRLLVLPMPGDGMADFKSFDAALSIMLETNNYPILVHCARGSYRTGAVIALYRAAKGWDMDRILEEMRDYRFTRRSDHPLIAHLETYINNNINTNKPAHAIK